MVTRLTTSTFLFLFFFFCYRSYHIPQAGASARSASTTVIARLRPTVEPTIGASQLAINDENIEECKGSESVRAVWHAARRSRDAVACGGGAWESCEQAPKARQVETAVFLKTGKGRGKRLLVPNYLLRRDQQQECSSEELGGAAELCDNIDLLQVERQGSTSSALSDDPCVSSKEFSKWTPPSLDIRSAPECPDFMLEIPSPTLFGPAANPLSARSNPTLPSISSKFKRLSFPSSNMCQERLALLPRLAAGSGPYSPQTQPTCWSNLKSVQPLSSEKHLPGLSAMYRRASTSANLLAADRSSHSVRWVTECHGVRCYFLFLFSF